MHTHHPHGSALRLGCVQVLEEALHVAAEVWAGRPEAAAGGPWTQWAQQAAQLAAACHRVAGWVRLRLRRKDATLSGAALERRVREMFNCNKCNREEKVVAVTQQDVERWKLSSWG